MNLTSEISVLVPALLFVELGGIFLGFCLKKQKDYRKQNTYKFLKSKGGILRLNSRTGEVVFIRKQNDEVEIHKGKSFPNQAGYFDLAEMDTNSYVLYDKWTGYFTVLDTMND